MPQTGLLLRRAATVAVGVGLAVVAACGNTSPDEATPTTANAVASTTTTSTTAPPPETTTPSTTTTKPKATPSTAPAEVPPVDQITPAYVKGVLDELHTLFRDAMLIAKTENAFSELYFATMAVAFTPDAAMGQTNGLKTFGGIDVVAQVPGRASIGAVEILQTDPDCVFGSAEIDLGPFVSKPIEVRQPYFVRLVGTNKSVQNPTPWLIAFESFTGSGKPPKDEGCPP